MNLGKFAVQAIREWAPFAPENIAHRKTNKAVRKILRKMSKGKPLTAAEETFMAENTATVTLPDGTVVQRPEPTIPARTSTKIAVSGVVAFLPIIQGIQEIEFPWPWLEGFTNSDLFVQVATLAAAYLVARMSKSPAKPGAL